MGYWVAVEQYNTRSKMQSASDSDADKNNNSGDSESCKDRCAKALASSRCLPPSLPSASSHHTHTHILRLETIMMPRGSVSCEDRDIGLASLRDINVST